MGTSCPGSPDKIGKLSSSTGPIAGALLGVKVIGLSVGAALAAAINDGMQQEGQPRSLPGTAPRPPRPRPGSSVWRQVRPIRTRFGESVEANLSTLTLALQNNVIDPGATQQDAEKVLASLDTISTALDGEVSESVLAVSALMSTGLLPPHEAADIANAVGGSVNKGNDLLEVINEYSVGWKKAGISAEMSIALMEQATDSGLFTADNAGDALREWGRRMSRKVTPLSLPSMTWASLAKRWRHDEERRRRQQGSLRPDVRLDSSHRRSDETQPGSRCSARRFGRRLLRRVRELGSIEALKNFGEFDGAAGKLAATIGGNTATSVKGAMNSISTVADGFKAALAQAFGPQIKEWADNISNNRVGVIQFFEPPATLHSNSESRC